MSTEKLRQDADYVARLVADQSSQRTNPHAYGRAHAMVMNGVMTRKEFTEARFNPADVY